MQLVSLSLQYFTILNLSEFIQVVLVLFPINLFLSTFIILVRHNYRQIIGLLCLLLSCISAMTSYADSYNTGAVYFANGDYATALNIWMPLAKQGNPAAQYSIGLLYDQGKGVNKDSQQALKYFQQAVEQNLPAAQYYLGIKYYAGLGVEKSPRKARQLLTEAAHQDHLQAQYQLGILYDKGEGGSQDIQAAIKWLTKAAESGFGPAQHRLAAHLLTGKDVQPNTQEGIFWLQKAAEQNDSDAMRDLGYIYFQGMGVEKDFLKARNLLEQPAEEGSALAQFLLAEIYALGGHGVSQNKRKAKQWYQRAQASGYKQAQQGLAKLNTSSSQKENVQPQVHKKSITSTPSQTPIINTQAFKDATQFKQLNEQWFVLQILQARQFDSISKLTDQFSDQYTYLFKIRRQNEPMFVLIYGHYPTYSAAKQAIDTLPAAFKLKSTPWIRQVKAVKALIPQL